MPGLSQSEALVFKLAQQYLVKLMPTNMLAQLTPYFEPNYIQGVRGVVERNTMRYYLAIDAYLAALKDAPDTQQEKRLQYWFDSTEQYATQLHEVERTEYFSMKRDETRRQSVTR